MDRMDRINEQMKREISVMIQQDIRDPRLAMVTITGVKVSRDLSHAKVSYSVLGDAQRHQEAQDGLDSASGFIRRLVAQRVRLRQTPEIDFVFDASIEYDAKIEETLQDIHRYDAPPGAAHEPESGGAA